MFQLFLVLEQTMNKMLRLIVVLLLGLAAGMAQAVNDYTFSYTWSNGDVITGGLSGNASGNLINDLTHISFSLNGVVVTGPIGRAGDEYGLSPAIASFDGRQNKLVFYNSDFSSFFISADAGPVYGPPGTNFFGVKVQGVGDACDNYTGDAGPGFVCKGAIGSTMRWTDSAVPEPSTALMLLGGLAGLGVLARRRARS